MPLILALLLLLSPIAAEAQRRPRTSVTAPRAWPLESIAIEGNKAFTREQVIAAAGLRLGQPVAEKDLDAARDRLLATGCFESVAFRFEAARDGKGYAASFDVREAEVFPVRFEDLGIPDERAHEAMKQAGPLYGPRSPGTEPVLKRYAAALGAAAGKPVVGKVITDDSGALVVLFRPAEAPPAISRVTFTNNQVVPLSALENAINPVAIGRPYREARFRELLDANVRPLYDARGRVRASFPEIRTEKDKTAEGLAVSVKVDEGASYSLAGVNVEGAGLPVQELLKAADLKTGDVFNIDQVHAGAARVEKRLRRDGYMRVGSSIERRIDDAKKTVSITIRVVPGPRFMFGRLNIEGLDIISEPAVRKMWSLKPGEPFNADYPDYFLNQIREEGIFDNLGDTKALSKADDADRTVDVTLIFKGAPPPKPDRRRRPGAGGL